MPDEPPPCHLCGKESVMDVDDVAWCEGCLHAKGSCCGESGMDEGDEPNPCPAARADVASG